LHEWSREELIKTDDGIDSTIHTGLTISEHLEEFIKFKKLTPKVSQELKKILKGVD